MNWLAFGTIADVVGAIGVIVTLVYLAYQIRQNTEQSRLGSIDQLVTRVNGAFDPIYIPENTRIWTKGLMSPGSLEADEEHLFNMLMMRLVASFDSTTYQWDHGAVPDALYDGVANFLAVFIATPGGTAWYERNRAFFQPETRKRLEAALTKVNAAAPST